jgi:hypothetical protein
MNMIVYATKRDADSIRTWINGEPEIAWIVKVSEQGCTYHWKAVHAIDAIEEQAYALWHVRSGRLNVPSGDLKIPDTLIADPFAGWSQTIKQPTGVSTPWFGSNLPGPYHFNFAEAGSEAPGSLARSDFSWHGDRFRPIGMPARPEAKRWWNKLRRFLLKSSVQVPWTNSKNSKRVVMVHVFPDAKQQIDRGRHRDLNPRNRRQSYEYERSGSEPCSLKGTA